MIILFSLHQQDRTTRNKETCLVFFFSPNSSNEWDIQDKMLADYLRGPSLRLSTLSSLYPLPKEERDKASLSFF